jgi:predicted nucleic acid-binding protein
MKDNLITLDTNILVYAIDIDAGPKQQRAIAILEQVQERPCVITLQALVEFVAVVLRKHGMPIEDAIAQVQDWRAMFPVIAASANTLTKAAGAVKQHQLSFWDALLWATACEAKVTLLLTEDCQHRRVLEGVHFFNPFLEEPLAWEEFGF